MKTVIGIISYNDKHYLEKTLSTIVNLLDSHIIIIDNAENDEIKEFIKAKYPQIEFIRHKDGNIGFGKGHNYIVEKSPDSQYYFCLNSDILVEEDGFKACIDYLDNHNDTCMISAKLHHWDFEKDKKTDIIDTLGIIGNRAHHFWDRGQGKKDEGQYDEAINNIFGISGAAFIIRRSCIKKIQGSENKIFDENIFMYKEDVDLAFRLRWLGLQIKFLPNILGYHARTLGKGKKKSMFEATMSYRNHRLMLRNNFSRKFSLQTKLMTNLYEFYKFMYYLFTKPEVAKKFFEIQKLKNLHKTKKEVSPKNIEKLLLN